jgi:hypothetical protein
LAYLDAKKAINKLLAEGKWPLTKAPTCEDIIEVFVSKSAFFKNHQPYFSLIPNHPMLHDWLLNKEDVPSNLEA